MMEAAIHVKPFGFDRVFHISGGDEPAAPGDDTPELLEKIADLQRQLASLEKGHRIELERARADGFSAGTAQARQSDEAAFLAAADAINAAIEQIDQRLDWAIETMKGDAAHTALAAAEVLAGHAIDHLPTRAIDEALDRVLSQVARGTALTIRVHPELLGAIERQIVKRAEQDRRKLTITAVADPSIAVGDADISWEEGGLEVDMAERRAAVHAEIAPLLERATSQ
jgi:flagellar assembly protein FliH